MIFTVLQETLNLLRSRTTKNLHYQNGHVNQADITIMNTRITNRYNQTFIHLFIRRPKRPFNFDNQFFLIWPIGLGYIVHLFSSVAHVWVPGARTTGPIVKKCFSFLF
jgi:hypothetical protein